ncbi:MAG: radical SAM protein [Anaerolineae bacterium]|nr:radical SAM protein [Anaerolineae bacterium]
MGITPNRVGHVIEWRTKRWRQRLLQPVKYMAYKTGQTRWVPPPDRMYIESTNICNLKCVMCPTGRGEITRPKGFMDFDLFKRIVDEMSPWVKTTTLHIWGEPLLHKRIFDMIAYCNEKGLRSEISTNATLLDEERAKRLLESGLSVIYLSLDGMRPETYQAIRVQADYERTNENIRRFIQMKREGGYKAPFVNLQIIQMKQTQDEIEEFVRAWSIPGVDRINVKPFDSWAGQIEEVNELRSDDPSEFMPEQRYPCPNLWYHVHIYWDGSLAMCDRDYNSLFPLGNVKDGVMKAWNGPRMQELRRLHVTNQLQDVAPCNKCSEWAWWRPTPFSSHGNYNAALVEEKGGNTIGPQVVSVEDEG